MGKFSERLGKRTPCRRVGTRNGEPNNREYGTNGDRDGGCPPYLSSLRTMRNGGDSRFVAMRARPFDKRWPSLGQVSAWGRAWLPLEGKRLHHGSNSVWASANGATDCCALQMSGNWLTRKQGELNGNMCRLKGYQARRLDRWNAKSCDGVTQRAGKVLPKGNIL